MNKSRLHHFDILKGIAIFMVVMGHVLTMCIRDIDNAVLLKLVEKIHMPIFFFISGYFTYKVQDTGKLCAPKLWSRAKQLLIPFFVVSTLWILYFPHSGLQSPFISTCDGLYFSAGKNGYWFTLCLFEVILLYCAMLPLLSRCRTVTSWIVWVAAVWILLGFLSKELISENVVNLLGLTQLYEFFPVFMTGVVARSKQVLFDRIISNNTCITVSLLVGGVLMYCVCWPWEFSLSAIWIELFKCMLYICVVITAVSAVKPWSKSAFSEIHPGGTRMARMWMYLGSQSLAVYLLHYFFLFPIPMLREPLIGMHLNIVPTLIVAAFFASAIIAVTLGVNYIISRSSVLALLLTGKIKTIKT